MDGYSQYVIASLLVGLVVSLNFVAVVRTGGVGTERSREAEHSFGLNPYVGLGAYCCTAFFRCYLESYVEVAILSVVVGRLFLDRCFTVAEIPEVCSTVDRGVAGVECLVGQTYSVRISLVFNNRSREYCYSISSHIELAVGARTVSVLVEQVSSRLVEEICPLAFILSQDQTLRCINSFLVIRGSECMFFFPFILFDAPVKVRSNALCFLSVFSMCVAKFVSQISRCKVKEDFRLRQTFNV